MNKEQLLIQQYHDKGILTGNNEVIIYKKFCFDFIQSCKELKLRILGIDGYILDKNKIKPNLIEVVDFSKKRNTSQDCYILAASFIKNMLQNGYSNGYLFTVD